MTRLDSALARFNQALDRVDDALRRPATADISASRHEMEALEKDRAHLSEQLDQVRGDYATLQSLTDEVETRLDTAIDNIRRVMRG